jgi:hypothetical protein
VANNESKPDIMEIALIVFLILVVIVAVLTILGPQIEGMVQRMTGR